MDGLRLALIIFGIVVVAVVYFWTAHRRRLDREAGNFDRFHAWADEDLDPLAPSASNGPGQAGRDVTAWAYEGDDVGDDGGHYQGLDDRDSAGAQAQAIATSGQGDDEPTQRNLRSSAIEDALREDRKIADSDHRQAQNKPVSARPSSAPAQRHFALNDDGERAQAAPDAPVVRHEAEILDDKQSIAGALGSASAARVAPRIGPLDGVKVIEQRGEPTLKNSTSAGVARTPGRATGVGAGGNEYAQGTHHSSPARDESHASAELVVVLNVMARAEQTFSGPALKIALEAAGLKAGDMQLYHYRAETQSRDTPPIFSALNAVKPGTLDEHNFARMRTPGIALVLRTSGLERPSEAFELMLVTARAMAERLDGQVCDDSRSSLTGQALNHLREQIATRAFRAQSRD